MEDFGSIKMILFFAPLINILYFCFLAFSTHAWEIFHVTATLLG